PPPLLLSRFTYLPVFSHTSPNRLPNPPIPHHPTALWIIKLKNRNYGNISTDKAFFSVKRHFHFNIRAGPLL
ncbi:MAG: hypothetical protein LBU32_29700, partial [Clostridiales bacterium]|nr:hypothetical protein [Clostridiales bacterium]